MLFRSAVMKRMESKQITLDLKQAVYDHLGDQGYDQQFGARPLNRLIQNTILNRIANMIIGNEVAAGDTIVIDVKNGSLTYDVKSKRSSKSITARVKEIMESKV